VVLIGLEMAQSEPECDVEAAEETNKAREGLPSPLRAEDDKIVSAVAEINQVNQRIKRT